MRAIGLPGHAVLPMVLSTGCTVPAIGATRTLDDPSDRLRVAAALLFRRVLSTSEGSGAMKLPSYRWPAASLCGASLGRAPGASCRAPGVRFCW